MVQETITVSFNWTKVELKLHCFGKPDEWVRTFNWTKVELKLSFQDVGFDGFVAFNWTKVELKRNFDAVPNAKRAYF